MAQRQIALLRGINVGRAKRVAMADLRALVTDLGHADVSTLLNSGNIVFTASGNAKATGPQLEKAILVRLGVSARVTILSAAELADIVSNNPLKGVIADPSRSLVAVFSNVGDRAHLVPLAQLDVAPDRMALGKRWAYLWCDAGVLESPLAKQVGKLLGDRVTSRNWSTMLKLHALVAGRVSG